jgi:hypothetical protein
MTTISNVRLIETDSNFLEKVSTAINDNGEQWYFMPFWFRKISEGVYEQVPFEKLPNRISHAVRNLQNNNSF